MILLERIEHLLFAVVVVVLLLFDWFAFALKKMFDAIIDTQTHGRFRNNFIDPTILLLLCRLLLFLFLRVAKKKAEHSGLWFVLMIWALNTTTEYNQNWHLSIRSAIPGNLSTVRRDRSRYRDFASIKRVSVFFLGIQLNGARAHKIDRFDV